MKRVRPFYESELIKVIMGICGCGKSTLLRQIKEELVENGIAEAQIIEMNFEDSKYRKYHNPDEFYAYVEEQLVSEDKYYLLFDEIQNVTDFELVVNSFRATHNVSIFLTGSNSKLLSGKLATHLGGRTVSFYMMPFSFREFCMYRGEEKGTRALFV